MLAGSEYPLARAPAQGTEGAVRWAEFALLTAKITDGTRRALAVWVTRRGELAPLQATGGWLER